jgi:signal-transduction protein with cAMP-binding, CBS, and nucleotidyltransferase domain
MVTAMSLMKRDLAKMAYSATVLEAAKMIRERKIGSVFIAAEATHRRHRDRGDIVRRTVGVGHMPGFIPVSTIMSSPVIGIDGRRPVTEAADLMERSQTRHLEALDDRSDMSMWTPSEIEREVNIAGTWICIRGLGLPPSSAVDESRICILMEERES